MSETAKSIEARLDEIKNLSNEKRIEIAQNLQNRYVKMMKVLNKVVESGIRQGHIQRPYYGIIDIKSETKIENSMQEVTRTFTK